MSRTLVISDIHGCLTTFRKLLEEIELTRSDTLYLLGDYIDRGPQSKGVLDYIIWLRDNGYQVFPLRGNHEQMMLNAYFEQPFGEKSWLRNGGESTILSFGISDVSQIPDKYIRFAADLPYYIETEKYILVHAGLNFETENLFEDKDAMIWIRSYQVDPLRINNRIIVHGHTPTSLKEIKHSIDTVSTGHRIILDNGCVFGDAVPGYGNLCCLNLDDLHLWYCQKSD